MTIHTGAHKVFVAISVDFEDKVAVGNIERLIAETETQLRADWPEITAIYVKPKASTV